MSDHHQLHRRAVRVGDDPLVGVDRVVVDLGDHQRDVLVHAPVAGVVDHDRAGVDQLRRPLGADLAARGGEGDVDALDRVLVQLRHLEVRRREIDAAGRAPRRTPAARRGPEVALGEHLEDRRARPRRSRRRRRLCSRSRSSPKCGRGPRAGRDRRPVLGARGSSLRTAPSPSSKASCRALTASGTRSAADHAGDLDRRGGDHLDVDPLLAERLEDLGGDARMAAHPGADDRDLADPLVGLDPDAHRRAPRSPRRPRQVVRARP